MEKRPNGPQLVSYVMPLDILIDISKKHLPPVEQGGVAISAALLTLVQTIRPSFHELKIIFMCMYGINVTAKLLDLFDVTVRLVHPNYDDQDNAPYAAAVTALLNKIKEILPTRSQCGIIRQCVQKANETPNDYFQRLLEVFKIYSGLQEEEGWRDAPHLTPFEYFLCTNFLDGLIEPIREAVKKSYIGWDQGPRITKMKSHATHAYKKFIDKKEKEEKKKEKMMEDAQLAFYQAVPRLLQVLINLQQRGCPPGPPQNQGPYTYSSRDSCYNCGQRGHWARFCPH